MCTKHFWDFLFQLMKHGTNALHVAIYIFVQCSIYSDPQLATAKAAEAATTLPGVQTGNNNKIHNIHKPKFT